MLNIPESIKNLFQTDGVRKNFRASFPNGELPDITNDNIVQESVRFTESLCSQDVLKFGLTEASVIEFETVGVANMYGMQIRCSCEIDVSSLPAEEIAAIGAAEWDGELVELAGSDLGWPFFRVPYGEFRVESCPRNHEAMTRRKVTAYSKSFAQTIHGQPFLPEQSYLPQVLVDPSALLCDEYENLTATEVVFTASETAPRPLFYDKWGGSAYISFLSRKQIATDPSTGFPIYAQRSATFNSMDLGGNDFVQVDYDAKAPVPLFEKTIASTNEVVENWCYDADGNQVYATVRDAIGAKMPWLRRPTLVYDIIAGDTVIPNAMQVVLESGVRYPIINAAQTKDEVLRSFAFSQLPTDAMEEEDVFSIRPYLLYGNADEVVSYNTPDNYILVPVPPQTLPEKITLYTLQRRASYRVAINASGELPGLDSYGTVSGESALLHVRQLSYKGSVTQIELLDGQLEIDAQFGKVNRRGEPEFVRLSDAAPVALTPGQYQNFWWDEFNVEPIGKIAAAFTDEEGNTQEFAYRIGPGASTYDMTSNAVLANLYGGSVSVVQKLLAERFVPYLGPVNFTPIDLDMRGLPYLEDGDYLSVTAEDGTVACSYNMRHELSGVQVLAASVTSVSGEIIDSEEGNE